MSVHPLSWSDMDRLRATLFARAPAPLYAIVDCARSPRAYPLVRDCALETACLYDGDPPNPLREAAPYLVRLQANAPFVADLIAHGWGEAWGIYAASHVALDDLRRHLRTLLRVRDPDGRVLLFRFYDPRVLRLYAPTCTPDERARLFGPIEQFLVEDDAGEVIALARSGARS
ncbi:MAG TPA: DUF4123 domain-containing protein [Polyangia bacterium]|nr:DUF4123 domain-containing protein [Polyangia bacterium]